MLKKLFTAIVLITFSACAFGQSLKIIRKPKLTRWDISEKAQQDFVAASEIFADMMEGERKYEDLTDKEKDLYDGVDETQESFFETVGGSCSWYCGGGPDTGYATSALKSYKDISYGSDNIHDFDASTAWIEGVKGYGVGEKITFSFPAKSPPVTVIKVYNGYMKSEKTWAENSRVRLLKMYVNDKPYVVFGLEDFRGSQEFDIDTLIPGDEPLKLTFEIADVYPGSKYDETAISEINFDGIGVHCFAAGTLVKMADGSEKPIENIICGDKIETYNFSENKTESATVLATDSRKHHNLVKITTSEGVITATSDHPFYIQGKGWCAVNVNVARQYAGMEASNTLEKGDFIYYLNKGIINYAEIISIEEQDICVPAYTITKLSNGNSFFANGCLVVVEE